MEEFPISAGVPVNVGTCSARTTPVVYAERASTSAADTAVVSVKANRAAVIPVIAGSPTPISVKRDEASAKLPFTRVTDVASIELDDPVVNLASRAFKSAEFTVESLKVIE